MQSETKYVVEYSGAKEEFDSKEEAVRRCWALARSIAEGKVETDQVGCVADLGLDSYEHTNSGRRWGGVCPDNNDGAFWPAWYQK